MIRFGLSFFLTAVTAVAATAATTQPLIEQGYGDMYNLLFDKAHQTFRTYEGQRPEDPLGPVSDAAACLFSEFERLHVLQSEFFTSDKNYLAAEKRQPDPATKARFNSDLEKTRQLAQAEMQQPGEKANAMFADTLRLGLEADYLALIERRDFAALGEIRKARELAEQLVSDNPSYYDAYIAVGVENYLLSRKPAPVRWFLRASGSQTDKQTGIEKLRLTAEHGNYLMPYARLLLAVAALRDGDKNDARKLLSWLADHYPRNNLYREELAKLN
jgi:hypothetical protein